MAIGRDGSPSRPSSDKRWTIDDRRWTIGCRGMASARGRDERTGLKAVPTSGNGGCWFVVVGSWTNDDGTIDDVCRGMASRNDRAMGPA